VGKRRLDFVIRAGSLHIIIKLVIIKFGCASVFIFLITARGTDLVKIDTLGPIKKTTRRTIWEKQTSNSDFAWTKIQMQRNNSRPIS
jgi:hypothetical protein